MINYLIVGGFPNKKSNIIGGQITACNNLFPNHLYNLKNTIRFDTTQISNPPPNLINRLYFSILRFPLFLYNIYFKKPINVIILMSSGTSFLEKTLYAFIANLFRSKTIIVPRSDLIIEQVKSKLIYKIFFWILISSTKKFIFQSPSFLKAFPKLKNKEYEILPNCINVEKIEIAKKEKFLPDYEFHLLFVGWLEPIKNISLLLDAVKIIKDLLPRKSIILHIVGNGSEISFLRKKSNKNNLNTIFHGWINDKKELNKIYSRANCFCLTSQNEGFPNVVLEAMKNGLPIVSTKVGALPHWLKEEKNILFSEKNNSRSYALQILKLLSSKNLYNSISKNNLNDIKNRFNCKIISEELKMILDD